MTSTKSLYLAARKAKHPIAAILGLLAVSLPVFPQLNLGHIFGAVTDQSGAAISGAMVTITDVSRGVTRTVTTDSAGEYSAPSLVPSTYTVRAENPGFNPAERQNFTLTVGQELRIDLSMQPGTQNQTIVVTGTPPIVNTSSAMISTTIDTQSINELPLNGGLYTKLLDYTIPGLAGRPGGNSPAYSSNGAGIFSQMWMLDGVDDVNEFAASGPLFGAATSQDELTVLPGRCDSGSECGCQSAGGIWLAARRGCERGTEVGHQQRPRDGLRIWPRYQFGCEESLPGNAAQGGRFV